MPEPLPQEAFATSDGNLAITLENVGVVRDGCPILDGINWQVPVGARAAVLGANGSGKTSLLRLLTGYYFPTTGVARILGQRLGDVNLHVLRQRIGLVDPAGPYAPDGRLTAAEAVLTGFFGHLCLDFDEPTQTQRVLAGQALEQLGLARHARQRFGTLSVGEQRRTLLARALVQRPQLLILDEPTAGLDLLGRETFLATLDALARAAPAMTILLVTHHLEELAPSTDHVHLLAKGRTIAAGPPAQVLTAPLLSAAFGCPVQIEQRQKRWSWSVDASLWTQLLRE